MPSATLTAPTNPSLDQSHHRALEAASRRSKPIRRAARVAAFNGWTTAVFALFSAPFACFSLVGLAVFAGLAAAAWNEFRGRRRLAAFDPKGATILGWNQLGLLLMVAAYCGWSLYHSLAGAGSLEAQLAANPDLKGAVGSLEGLEGLEYLYRTLVAAIYGSVILLSVVLQGANAVYYFTRRRLIENYLRETPAWVLDLQRATQMA
jgi:hypothetical protein